VNLILFNSEELEAPLKKSDPRAVHILEVLRMDSGQKFDVGLVNGPRGKARWKDSDKGSLQLSFAWETEVPTLLPIDLWVSFCRPQTCRRILQECTSLGVRSINFFDTEKSEPNYRKSKLWTTGEAERLLVRGAEQAFCTQIPLLRFGNELAETIEENKPAGTCLALDNYESTKRLGAIEVSNEPITLAVGGERGWSNLERDLLRKHGFTLVDLGSRVLRTETACISGISILSIQAKP
jgi:16S rRNA (uracil1498-N3)-methyltransferase